MQTPLVFPRCDERHGRTDVLTELDSSLCQHTNRKLMLEAALRPPKFAIVKSWHRRTAKMNQGSVLFVDFQVSDPESREV